MSISLDNVAFEHECYIAAIVHNILGMDFLTSAGALIDPKRQSMTLGMSEVQFILPSTQVPSCGCGGSFFKTPDLLATVHHLPV